jgi:hypothetical protein
MKKLIVIGFLFILGWNTVSAQTVGLYCKRHAISWSCLLIAGGVQGFITELQFNYPAVKRRFNTNDQFWNPSISWTNKYKNHDPKQGEKFFGSTTFLAWTTDGFHFTQAIRNVGIIGGVSIIFPRKVKWYWYVRDYVINALIFGMANFTAQAIIK